MKSVNNHDSKAMVMTDWFMLLQFNVNKVSCVSDSMITVFLSQSSLLLVNDNSLFTDLNEMMRLPKRLKINVNPDEFQSSLYTCRGMAFPIYELFGAEKIIFPRHSLYMGNPVV
ncbi:hypothetical protein NPIL_650871 [Nephila pilipes]|uniref:Uncharacterized protein n=1 Tax=Nephila pilipes TaxID=299642 RepID=A0A8X6PRY8_NEPPI|nr:hypothetical protein NPIL_650871 [Nephila pilipes]